MWSERSNLLRHKNIFKINVSMRNIINISIKFAFYSLIAIALIVLTLLLATNDLKGAYALEIKASTSCQIGQRFQNETDVWFEHKTNCFEVLQYDPGVTPYQLFCNPESQHVKIIAPMGQITPFGIFNINLVEKKFYALLVKQAYVNVVNKCDHWLESDPEFKCPDGYECHRETFESSSCIKHCLLGTKRLYADYQYIVDVQEVYWYTRPSVDVKLTNIEDYTITAHVSIDSCVNGFIISNGQIYCINDPANAPKWIFFSNTTFDHNDVVTAIRSLFSLSNYCNEKVTLYREPVFSDGSSISVYAEVEGESTIECPTAVGITGCDKGKYFYENGTYYVTFDKMCILENAIVTSAEYQHCVGCNLDCSWATKGSGENSSCSRGQITDFKESVQVRNPLQKKVCNIAAIIIYVGDSIILIQWLYVSIHVIIYLVDYCKAKEEVQLIQESHGKFIKQNYQDALPFEKELMSKALLDQIMRSQLEKSSKNVSLGETELIPTSTKKKKLKDE